MLSIFREVPYRVADLFILGAAKRRGSNLSMSVRDFDVLVASGQHPKTIAFEYGPQIAGIVDARREVLKCR